MNQNIKVMNNNLFFCTDRNIYQVIERESGEILITRDGENSIPNVPNFLRNLNLDRIEDILPRCVVDNRNLNDFRTATIEQRRAEAAARKKLNVAHARVLANEDRAALQRLIDNSAGKIAPTRENLEIIANALRHDNYGSWELPTMTIGYRASQYDGNVIAMIFDQKIELTFNDGSREITDRVVFGAGWCEMLKYTHLRY